MSAKVCVYSVSMREAGSISRYVSSSSSVANKPVSPSSPLISVSTMAALSQRAADLSVSPSQNQEAMASASATQSRKCSLPEIPNSPSARSLRSSDAPLLIQVTNVTEKQKKQASVESSQHSTAAWNSTFPNFRGLQRLALSAKTRTVSHSENARRSSTTSDYSSQDLSQNSTSSDLSSSRTPLLNSADDRIITRCSGQDLRQGRSLDDKGLPAGFSAPQSLPGNTQGDLEGWKSSSSEERIQVNVADHSVSPKFHKKKSAKKKKRKTKRAKSKAPPTQRMQDSRRFSSDKKHLLPENSLSSLLQAMPVVVEAKKIEVYSSRYNKCDAKAIASHRIETKTVVFEKGNCPKHLYKDLPQGALPMTKISPPERDPVVYASRVSPRPRIPGTSGLNIGSRHQDNVSRLTRVYLSETQSGSLRECGLILPCAPPGTPTPQMLQRYQYVPSMMDLRSQRAVRDRLSGMEQKAKKKQQQQREEARKTEEQLQRDQTVAWKRRQRQEIYALNKIMTDFEKNNFQEFMRSMSEKTPL